MLVAGFAMLGLMLVAGLYAILIYNRLVGLKHDTAKAWSNIDVLLKQRHDELPKLVETCKRFIAHERDILERIMQARAGVFEARKTANLPALGTAEGLLRQGLASLFILADNYPALRANESFRNLEARISGLENAIADRREFYNEAASSNNMRLEEFPDIFIARLFGFESCDLLEFSDAERADVDINALFR